MRSGLVGKARADIEICALNGAIQVAVGFQQSDDLNTWVDETGVLSLAYQSANGMAHATSFADFTSAINRAYVRPVYYIKLSSGSGMATAFVKATVDVVPRI